MHTSNLKNKDQLIQDKSPQTIGYQTRRPLDEEDYVFNKSFDYPFFGSDILELAYLKDSSMDEETMANNDIELRKACIKLRNELIKIASTRAAEEINNFYQDKYQLPLQKPDPNINYNLIKFLTDEATPNQMIDFINWNKEYITNLKGEKDQDLKDKLNLSRSNVLNFLHKSNFPVDYQTIEQKLDRVDIGYSDPILDILENRNGRYFLKEEHIHVSVRLLDNFKAERDEVETITHELLHVISGRMLISKRDENNNYLEHILPRVGYGLRNSYIWLDEALTEQLAQLINNGYNLDLTRKLRLKDRLFRESTMQSGTYNETRQFTKILLDNYHNDLGEDITSNLLIGYFEDYIPDKEAKKRSPLWRETMQKLGDYLTPQNLQKLNSLFASRKIIETLIEQPKDGKKDKILRYLGYETKPKIKDIRSKETIRDLHLKRNADPDNIKINLSDNLF